jgi:hypothetical protein
MAEHPLEQAARLETPGQEDRIGWARAAGLEADALLAAARALGPATRDDAYAAALRAAAARAFTGQRDFGTWRSLRWMEDTVRALEQLAVARFGPYQAIVTLGYEPVPMPSGGGPRSRFGL